MTGLPKSRRAQERAESPGLEDLLISQAEALIVKGREQGYLTPDEVIEGFPDLDAEPDELFRVFHAFEEMGIPVSDTERELGDSDDETDRDVRLGIEEMEMASIDDPV